MRAAVMLLLALGCGSDDTKPIDASTTDGTRRDAAVDAPPPIDAPPDAATAVQRVDCATATIARTVTTTDSPQAFVPNTVTINVNQVIRFQPGSSHNVIPHPTLPSDPGFRNGGFGEVACLRFTTAGQFNWRCQPHASMTGVVTVN
ncbi:MAG: hypothetical protein H0T89_01770 [Deltaproteobacteria bacterium]|nr:hypothetical protein [Deltaproteobacteria bacterium]